jgi:hypothetical protein
MLLCIKDELFHGKIVINGSLEYLYENFFKEKEWSNQMFFTGVYYPKIEKHFNRIYEYLKERQKTLEGAFFNMDIANIFKRCYMSNQTYDFFHNYGLPALDLIFISEDVVQSFATEIENNLKEMKSCLTAEEYENVFMEELDFYLGNIGLKKEELVYNI